MPVTTEKISGAIATRVGAVRELVDTKVMPVAIPAGQRTARQMRIVVQNKIVPSASSALDNAMLKSAPVRKEAMRRGRLAAAVLREGGVPSAVVVATKRRRWPMALALLLLGGAAGATAAWLSQAGRPVEMTPYPLASDTSRDGSDRAGEVTKDVPGGN